MLLEEELEIVSKITKEALEKNAALPVHKKASANPITF